MNPTLFTSPEIPMAKPSLPLNLRQIHAPRPAVLAAESNVPESLKPAIEHGNHILLHPRHVMIATGPVDRSHFVINKLYITLLPTPCLSQAPVRSSKHIIPVPSHPMNNHLAFCACPFIAALRNLYLILGYTHHITSAHHIIYTCGCSLYGDQTIGLFPRRTIKNETLAAFLLDPATSYRMFHQGRISMGLPTDLQRLFWSFTAVRQRC